jgi:membrane protein required for colicin V production
MELTLFDFIIFGILGFFALIGLMRGFVKEIFSIANWIIASIITIYLRPIITGLILTKINIPIVADLISNSFLFTTALILVSIITSNISKGISGIFPTPINVFFGLIFGFFKGYLISALIFSIIISIYGENKEKPLWFEESKLYQPLSIGSNFVEPFTNSLFGNLPKKSEEENLDETDSEINSLMDKIDSVKEKVVSDDVDEDSNNGYKEDQIKKMDRLIDTISD